MALGRTRKPDKLPKKFNKQDHPRLYVWMLLSTNDKA